MKYAAGRGKKKKERKKERKKEKKKERNNRTPPQCGNSPQSSGAYGWCLGTDFLFHLRGSLVTANQRAFGQAAGTHSVPEEFLVGPAFQRDL